MNAPMMLPWLARKWNVSPYRALVLWHKACADADAAGCPLGSPAYWSVAKTRLIDRLDLEAIRSYPPAETPWIMISLNVLRLVAWVRFWLGARTSVFR